MVSAIKITTYGNSRVVIWDDGTRTICYPTMGGMFLGSYGGAKLTLQPKGNLLNVMPATSGASKLAYPAIGGYWVMSGQADGGGTVPVGGTPGNGTPPPTGQYAVIFPCAVHNVSDSFQDHVNRGSVNPGTDYTASYGSDVWSVSAGVVTDIVTSIGGSGGRMIHIDNNDGSGSDYLHLSVQHVNVGDAVAQGQLIAQSGASGYGQEHYYGAHLHISYRLNHSHGYWNDGNIDFDALIHSEGLS